MNGLTTDQLNTIAVLIEAIELAESTNDVYLKGAAEVRQDDKTIATITFNGDASHTVTMPISVVA